MHWYQSNEEIAEEEGISRYRDTPKRWVDKTDSKEADDIHTNRFYFFSTAPSLNLPNTNNEHTIRLTFVKRLHR